MEFEWDIGVIGLDGMMMVSVGEGERSEQNIGLSVCVEGGLPHET